MISYFQKQKKKFLSHLKKWASSRENLFLSYANNEGADQPVHPRSLINTFVVRLMERSLTALAT